MHTGNSIIRYYGSVDSSDSLKARKIVLEKALEDELASNVLVPEEPVRREGGTLRLPAIMLAASLLTSVASLGISLKNYTVKMAALFYQPTSLFKTEALLIEALRKRTDLEISKRDRLIAEYRRRIDLREGSRMTALPADPQAMNAPPAAPASGNSGGGDLDELRRNSEMELLYAARLGQALATVARQVSASDMAGAQRTLTELRKSLGEVSARNSDIAQSSLGLTAALSASFAAMKGGAEPLPAKTVYLNDPEQEVAIQRLRAENSALLDRILALEARSAEPAAKTAAPVAGPTGEFLGTVALVNADLILVDLAQGARPAVGSRAEAYRTNAAGQKELLGEAVVRTIREGAIELQWLGDAATRPRSLDTVYMVQRGR